MTERNFDAEARDNDGRRYAYDIDWTVRRFMLDRFEPWIDLTGATLEAGSYEGEMTQQILARVGQLDALEASADMCRALRRRFPAGVTVIEGRIEDHAGARRYSNVFLIHTLEHVDDPVDVLRHLGSLLAPGGRLFVAVPNGGALSRQIAVQMGLIAHNTAITDGEARQGHQRTYMLDTLMRDIRSAGLAVRDAGGVLVKPLANFQIDRALEAGIMDDAFLVACERLAVVHPALASSIYAVCETIPS